MLPRLQKHIGWFDRGGSLLNNVIGVSVFSAAGALMTWAANGFTAIAQQGWGAVVFAGVGGACILALALSGALAAWRYANPLPASPAAALPEADSLGAMLAKDETTKPALDELRAEVERLSRQLRAQHAKEDLLSKQIKDLEDDKSRNDEIDKLGSVVKSNKAHFDQEIDSLYKRLFAHQALYDIHRIEPEIQRLADLVEHPVSNPTEDHDWGAWAQHYRRIRALLEQFSQIAAPFHPDMRIIMFRIPSDIYKTQGFGFENGVFPHPDLLHDYKSYRYIFDQYANIGRDIVKFIESQARA